jgi:hypothetical protein
MRIRVRRRDNNHKAICDFALKVGLTVIDLSQTPCGFDAAFGYGGLTMLVEIKNPKVDKTHQQLTENEKKVHDAWTGGAKIVMTDDDVLECRRILMRWLSAIQLNLLKVGDGSN